MSIHNTSARSGRRKSKDDRRKYREVFKEVLQDMIDKQTVELGLKMVTKI